MGIQKIIDGNDIQQGSIISHVDMLGSPETVAYALELNQQVSNSGVIVDRMKLNRYYSGDAAGGSTTVTVTYSIIDTNDDGRWRTSVGSAHDPGSANYYGSPSVATLVDILGFSRPS
tara:strand:- start:36 stop:386 length:351 start_codon:yes stop_codon:yes gene_type:complete